MNNRPLGLSLFMKKFLFVLAILYGVVVFPSCREISRHRQLRELWSFIDEAPDSALRVLEAMPSEHFLLPRDQADYALLKSIALDKNYIDLTDDSLARIATNWYEIHGRAERQLRAWYYLGRVQQNAGNASGAIVSFQKAQRLAEEAGDLFYEGMASRAMAYVYRHAYYNDEAIANMRLARDCFNASGRTAHASYATLDLAEMLCACDNYDECNALLTKLKTNLPDSDSQLSSMTTIVQGTCAYNEGRYHEAIALLRHAEHSSTNGLLSNATATLAHAYAKIGKRDSALFYLSKAFTKANTATERISATFIRYRIEEMDGEYKKAMQDASNVMFGQDSVFRTVLNQSVVAAQRDAFKESLLKEERNNSFITRTSLLSGVILILALALIILYARKKRIEQEDALDLVLSLSQEITEKERQVSEKDRLIANMFRQRLVFIDGISTAYINNDSSSEIGMSLLKMADKEISVIRKSARVFEELERIVNHTHNDVMKCFRKEVALKDYQYQLACCFFAGLSTPSIRLLTGETVSNIYKIKQRIKEKLEQEKPEHLSHFLQCMTGD